MEGPAYRIYRGKQKSWDMDLSINGVGLAVKTQSHFAAYRFGLSWTFQAGQQRYDPILDQPMAWVCFVEVDDATALDGNQPYLCRVFPPYQIQELTFREPRIERLKGSKKVIYAQDL